MGTVEQDTALYHAHMADIDRRYNRLVDSVLESLVEDILSNDCKAITLADVMREADDKEYVGMLSNILNASGDALILARDEFYTWMEEKVREYAEESDELDRRVWEQDQADREDA